MAEDPVTSLLKFANFATRQIKEIIKLGKIPVRQRGISRYKKKRITDHVSPYCIKQRNTCDQDSSEIYYGNADSKVISQEQAIYIKNQQESNSVQQNGNYCFEGNTQEWPLECSLHSKDPANLAGQEQWPSYTDKFSWYIGTVDENVELHDYTPAFTEIPDIEGDGIWI
jgi:hypothetical protein